jgi:DNA-binding IclR family transcriptional regulator
MPAAYQVPMVLKTLRVLEVLAQHHQKLSLTEITRRADVAKASAFRILQTLEGAGYVNKDARSGGYQLSQKVQQLCHAPREHHQLRAHGELALMALQREFNESANLAVLDQGEVLYLATVESTSNLRITISEMARAPIHCTALGKALAAYLPEDSVVSILELKGMPKRTDKTLIDISQFIKELAKVRRTGLAYEMQEFEPGSFCIAAPVIAGKGQVPAAISVSAPLSRLNGRKRKIEAALLKAARQLSKKLGSVTPST